MTETSVVSREKSLKGLGREGLERGSLTTTKFLSWDSEVCILSLKEGRRVTCSPAAETVAEHDPFRKQSHSDSANVPGPSG